VSETRINPADVLARFAALNKSIGFKSGTEPA